MKYLRIFVKQFNVKGKDGFGDQSQTYPFNCGKIWTDNCFTFITLCTYEMKKKNS